MYFPRNWKLNYQKLTMKASISVPKFLRSNVWKRSQIEGKLSSRVPLQNGRLSTRCLAKAPFRRCDSSYLVCPLKNYLSWLPHFSKYWSRNSKGSELKGKNVQKKKYSMSHDYFTSIDLQNMYKFSVNSMIIFLILYSQFHEFSVNPTIFFCVFLYGQFKIFPCIR